MNIQRGFNDDYLHKSNPALGFFLVSVMNSCVPCRTMSLHAVSQTTVGMPM